MREPSGFFSYYAIHSKKSGIFERIDYANGIMEKNIVEQFMNYSIGEVIPAYTGSNGTIGILLMKFETMDEMLHKMDHSEEWIKLIIEA
jgi:hypothetical protein